MGMIKLTVMVSLTLHPGKVRADDTPESKKCPQTLAPDGRTVREGTCIAIVEFDEGSFEIQIQDGRLLFDFEKNEIEIEYGAVRGLARSVEPDFVVRRKEHFLRAVVDLDSTLWVTRTDRDTEVTVQTEEGQTLISTSWTAPLTHRPEDQPFIVSLAPEQGGEMICSISIKGKSSHNMAVLLAIIAALSLVVRRQGRRP